MFGSSALLIMLLYLQSVDLRLTLWAQNGPCEAYLRGPVMEGPSRDPLGSNWISIVQKASYISLG